MVAVAGRVPGDEQRLHAAGTNIGTQSSGWSSMRSDGSRRASASMATRPVSRASDAPKHEWMPAPKVKCLAALLRSGSQVSGSAKYVSSWLAAANDANTRPPLGMWAPPSSTSRRA